MKIICPFTNQVLSKAQSCKGHIIPRSLNGSMTVTTNRKIDNLIGKDYDARLVNYVRRMNKYVQGVTNDPARLKHPIRCYLSLIHSAILFMTKNNLRVGNYNFFKYILIKSLKELGSVTEEEWNRVKATCSFKNTKDFEISYSEKMRIVAFKYDEALYGIFDLFGTLPEEFSKAYVVE